MTRSVGVRLLEHLREFALQQPREIQLNLKGLLTSRKNTNSYALSEWSRRLPPELNREVVTTKASLELLAMAPLLAWGYEQHWHKNIDLDVVMLRYRVYMENFNRTDFVETSTSCLGVSAVLMDRFPKPACEALLNFWLEPKRPIWIPDRLQSPSMLVSHRAGAWESLACMAASYPGRSKDNSPRKRWSTNLQACMAVMPHNVQALYIEHFLDSSMSTVDRIRGARCAHPSVWLKLSNKLLPLLPNNEWTRYDLLPACTPSAVISTEAAGQLNRELATLYAPALTHMLCTLACDANWANPGFMRGLVDQTYRYQKGLPLPKTEALDDGFEVEASLFS